MGIVLKELLQRSFYKGEERIGNKNEMLDVRGWVGRAKCFYSLSLMGKSRNRCSYMSFFVKKQHQTLGAITFLKIAKPLLLYVFFIHSFINLCTSTTTKLTLRKPMFFATYWTYFNFFSICNSFISFLLAFFFCFAV